MRTLAYGGFVFLRVCFYFRTHRSETFTSNFATLILKARASGKGSNLLLLFLLYGGCDLGVLRGPSSARLTAGIRGQWRRLGAIHVARIRSGVQTAFKRFADQILRVPTSCPGFADDEYHLGAISRR